MRVRTRIALIAAVAGLLGTAPAGAAAAEFGAGFGVADGSFSATLDGPLADQAGAQADFTTSFKITQLDPNNPNGITDGTLRRLEVELPAGLVANPTHWEECPFSMVQPPTGGERCPIETAVGQFRFKMINTHTGQALPIYLNSRVYRVDARPDEAAAFGFVVFGNPVRLHAKVDPSNGHRIRVIGTILNEGQPLLEAHLTMWGVPEDRQGPLSIPDGGISQPGAGTFGGPMPADVPRHRLQSVPTRCDGPFETKMTLRSWQSPVPIEPVFTTNPAVSGCEQLDFQPSIAVTPATVVAGQPSGYEVELTVPQNEDPYGLATPNLEDAVVTLPAGVAISPGQADGLQACSDAEFGATEAGPDGCPLASKIATVNIETPLLDEDLAGSLYVGTQKSQDPESGEMYRLLLAADGPGSRIKLAGSVKADRSTGQLTATFADNPQLPFSKMTLSFKGGDRGVLSNPESCGDFATRYNLSAWSGHVTDASSAPFAVSEACGQGFSPTVAAGVTEPVAGKSSAFTFRLNRPDGDQNVGGVQVTLPTGLLGRLAGIPTCEGAAAASGACDHRSRVGHTTVAVGSGAQPLYVPQAGKPATAVYLGGPYKGAPYSLVVNVPAEAGPFDLGNVVVRAALFVDPDDAHVRVATDPLPQIVGGVPMRYRTIHVAIDRPGFMFSPTSCAEKRIATGIDSSAGARADVSTRFWVRGCDDLSFSPEVAMRLHGKRQLQTGGHPALKAVMTQPADEANTSRARVALPKSIALDPDNSSDPEMVCGYDEALEANCPDSSVIGNATAHTPVLDQPLSGKVHLVQGIRFGPTGNRIRTTPALLVKLRGAVDIDLRAQTTVRNDRLVTTFPAIPDAPVSKFSMRIRGGQKKGILVVTRTRRAEIDLCDRKQIARVGLAGHNGNRTASSARLKTPCGKRRKPAAAVCRQRVNGKVAVRRCVNRVKRHRAQARRAAKRKAAQRSARS